jgi:hypothetical protein
MVESKVRKAAFLREAVRILGLVTHRWRTRGSRMSPLTVFDWGGESLTVRAVKTGTRPVRHPRALLREGGRLYCLAQGTQANLRLVFSCSKPEIAAPVFTDRRLCADRGPDDVSRETIRGEHEAARKTGQMSQRSCAPIQNSLTALSPSRILRAARLKPWSQRVWHTPKQRLRLSRWASQTRKSPNMQRLWAES